jgi:diadenylate cyclase
MADFLIPLVEIGAIAVIINYFLSFFWNTRAMDLVVGMVAFLSIFFIAKFFHLPVLQKLMQYVLNVAALAILIIFQPEIRFALSKLSIKGRRFKEMSEFDHFLDSIAQSIYRLADRRIGALILLENQDSLQEYAEKAVILNAEFSPELLESIFTTTTPLHDGGVIIRENKIVSAATILPLAEDTTQITKAMGTRHRAGLGISQLSDSLVIVVSEETGRVAIAREGIMTRGVKIDRFKGIVRSVFTPPAVTQKLGLQHWWKEWVNR